MLRINKVDETAVPLQGTVYAIFVKPLTFPSQRLREHILRPKLPGTKPGSFELISRHSAAAQLLDRIFWESIVGMREQPVHAGAIHDLAAV